MSYRSFFVDNVGIVEWDSASPSDVHEILKKTQDAKNACGRRIICVAIVKNSTTVPPAPSRNRMAKALPKLLDLSSSIHHVQHGISVRTARLLTFAIQLISGAGSQAYVNNSIRQALETAPVKSGRPIPELLEEIRKAGFSID